MSEGIAHEPPTPRVTPRRVFVVGATGYIGKHAVRELVARGHHVVCFARASVTGKPATSGQAAFRFGDVTDPASIVRDGICGERFDAVVSCLATRTGAPKDAWLVEDEANRHVLDACREAGATHFVLLSAICVQKPLLAFQHAKLAFERTLAASAVDVVYLIQPSMSTLERQLRGVIAEEERRAGEASALNELQTKPARSK